MTRNGAGSWLTAASRDVDSVSSMVVLDLKSQEFMNSLQGPRIVCANSDPASRVHRLKVIMNLIAEFGHCRHTRRRLVMNEHRDLEIALRKHFGDMRQMLANLVPPRSVLRVVRAYFDCTTVRRKSEMVRCCLLRKSHALLASLHHFAVAMRRVFVGHLLLSLRYRRKY